MCTPGPRKTSLARAKPESDIVAATSRTMWSYRGAASMLPAERTRGSLGALVPCDQGTRRNKNSFVPCVRERVDLGQAKVWENQAKERCVFRPSAQWGGEIIYMGRKCADTCLRCCDVWHQMATYATKSLVASCHHRLCLIIATGLVGCDAPSDGRIGTKACIQEPSFHQALEVSVAEEAIETAPSKVPCVHKAL